MKKKALVPLAPGFEEIEAVTIIDILRRGGIEVTTASVGTSQAVEGAHGIRVSTDVPLESVEQKSFDAVILPGGMPGTSNLAESRPLQRILEKNFKSGQITAAICAAPIVLAKYGMLNGKNATSYPGFQEKLIGANVDSTSPVVEDGTILTSQGPGTAMAFALKLVERLVGKETAQQVREGALAVL